MFGSEGGVEWAVPYGDYFEGILSKKTQAEPGSHIVPLMELVYGDCVALYPHMSEKIGTNGYNIRTTQCSCSARTMGAQFAPRRK